MIPKRLSPIVFGFIVSGIMSFLVSLVATVKAVGFIPGLFGLWMSAWLFAWAVACPTIILVGPVVRRFVERNTKKTA